MYRQTVNLTRYTKLQCPPCFKAHPEHRLFIFKKMVSFTNHLTKSHSLDQKEHSMLKRKAKAYLKEQPEKSFIETCFDNGVLY